MRVTVWAAEVGARHPPHTAGTVRRAASAYSPCERERAASRMACRVPMGPQLLAFQRPSNQLMNSRCHCCLLLRAGRTRRSRRRLHSQRTGTQPPAAPRARPPAGPLVAVRQHLLVCQKENEHLLYSVIIFDLKARLSITSMIIKLNQRRAPTLHY